MDCSAYDYDYQRCEYDGYLGAGYRKSLDTMRLLQVRKDYSYNRRFLEV